MAALGDIDIEKNLSEVFERGTAVEENVKAAKYYLRLGNRYLILPDGRRFSDDKEQKECSRPFVIKPGETALVSTKEKIAMPPHLSGVFGPVFDLTDEGILFFGGMLVDPGFGYEYSATEDRWHRRPEPLSFYLANIGSEHYQFRPGVDPIASIAFFEVTNPRIDKSHSLEEMSHADFPRRFESPAARKMRAQLFDRKAQNDAPSRALGLVEDIRDVRTRIEKLETSTNQVIIFGVVVLAAVLASTMATIAFERTAAVAEGPAWDEAALAVATVVGGAAGLTCLFYGFVKLATALASFRRRKRRAARWRN